MQEHKVVFEKCYQDVLPLMLGGVNVQKKLQSERELADHLEMILDMEKSRR